MEESQKPILQEGISKVLQHMISHNSNSPIISSRFHSHTAPAMSISAYVERIVKYTRCSCEALVGSLMFLQYHVTFSGHVITIFNVHRTLITSVVLAAKSRDDEYYTNTYYAKIGGIPANELKTLELDYITLLDWDCWLDRDAFDETVAMLVELATSNPTPADIVQIVSFWEEKQTRLAKSRRIAVRSAIAADVEAAKAAAIANGGMAYQNQQQSGSFGSIASPTTTNAYQLQAVVGSGFGGQQQNNNNNNNGMLLSHSTSSNPNSHLERLAFGGGSGSGNNTTSNNNQQQQQQHVDPFQNASVTSVTSTSSNLVVTAPCFYPKGMQQRSSAVAANCGTTGVAPKNLGINPYQQQQSSASSPFGGDFGVGGRSLNPYMSSNFNSSPTKNGGGGGGGIMSRTSTSSINNNVSAKGGFPAVPASYNPTAFTNGNNNNDHSSEPRTPTSDGGVASANNNNKPASWAAAVSSSQRNGGATASGSSLLFNANAPNKNATASPSSPSVVPQGAPGFNSSKANTNNNGNASSFGTPHGSPTNYNNNQTSSNSNNGRLLTKHRFGGLGGSGNNANGSGDNIAAAGGVGGGVGGSGANNNFVQRTPESNRYSIVGVNPNQHPNNYHFYNATADHHATTSTNNNRNGNNKRNNRNQNQRGSAGTPTAGSNAATTTNPFAAASTSSVNNGVGGGNNSPGIRLGINGEQQPQLQSTLSTSTAAANNIRPNSSFENLNDSESGNVAYGGGDDNIGIDVIPRAGSKRGATAAQFRQSGKKREVPSNPNWQQDER